MSKILLNFLKVGDVRRASECEKNLESSLTKFLFSPKNGEWRIPGKFPLDATLEEKINSFDS